MYTLDDSYMLHSPLKDSRHRYTSVYIRGFREHGVPSSAQHEAVPNHFVGTLTGKPVRPCSDRDRPGLSALAR